ncbi:hypothetical protein L9F63_028305, partial [Diploptera punctata]
VEGIPHATNVFANRMFAICGSSTSKDRRQKVDRRKNRIKDRRKKQKGRQTKNRRQTKKKSLGDRRKNRKTDEKTKTDEKQKTDEKTEDDEKTEIINKIIDTTVQNKQEFVIETLLHDKKTVQLTIYGIESDILNSFFDKLTNGKVSQNKHLQNLVFKQIVNQIQVIEPVQWTTCGQITMMQRIGIKHQKKCKDIHSHDESRAEHFEDQNVETDDVGNNSHALIKLKRNIRTDMDQSALEKSRILVEMLQEDQDARANSSLTSAVKRGMNFLVYDRDFSND